jgi:hypothetical protein
MSKPFRLKTIEPTEAQIQDAILRLLAIHPDVAWAKRFNTGSHVVEGTTKAGRKTRRFIRYAFLGCSDILGQLADGRFLAIECKRRGNKPTDEQSAFLETVNAAGGLALVARSTDDVTVALAVATHKKETST